MKCAEALAHLSSLQDEFAVRYYRWCVDESAREMEGGFPSLQAIKSHVAFLFLDFAQSCSGNELRSLITCGVKELNPRAVELLEVSIVAEEREIHQRFVDFFTKEVVWQGQRLNSLRVSTRESQIRDRELSGQTTTNIRAKELKQALEKTLHTVLGQPEHASSAGLSYSQALGPWYLKTSLDLAGHAQLNYDHLISARHRADLCPTHLNVTISPMNWCGIHRSTSFDLIQASEIQDVAETIKKFCLRTLQVVPDLLLGLQHGIPEEIESA